MQQQQFTAQALEMTAREQRFARIEASAATTVASRRELRLDWHRAASSR